MQTHLHIRTITVPEPVSRWLTTPHAPARPVMPVHGDEIDQLERAVRNVRAEKTHLSHEQERLVALVDKAIKAHRAQRDEDTTTRFILTLFWQARKHVAGDFWGVVDRDKDSMACMMLEKFFGGPYTPDHHPHRRKGDTPAPKSGNH